MTYSTEMFQKMVADSGMSHVAIYTKAGMSKQMFHDMRQPVHNSRLTRDKILRIAQATGSRVADYFPELKKDVALILDEPVEHYQNHTMVKEVKSLMEDLVIEAKRFRDDYISALLENKRLQDEMIELLKERAHNAAQ